MPVLIFLWVQTGRPSEVISLCSIELACTIAHFFHNENCCQKQEALKLEFKCQTIGEYRIKGQLTAEDISSTPYQLPFAFQITVGKQGKPYEIPDFQPYIIGEGLGDDRVFVARTELIHWLHSYWKQPEAKPAIALMGQRRMGKTSLLNKIQRTGLAELNLIPVLIDLQDGIQNDYVFLNKTA